MLFWLCWLRPGVWVDLIPPAWPAVDGTPVGHQLHTRVALWGCSFGVRQRPSGSRGSLWVPVGSHPAALALGSSEQTNPPPSRRGSNQLCN